MIVFSAEQSFERAGFASSPTDDPRGRYEGVRAETERLASGLTAEDQCVQSMPDASPVKWHRAHTTWFFESFILQEYVPGYCVFHPGLAIFSTRITKRRARATNRAAGIADASVGGGGVGLSPACSPGDVRASTERGDDPALSRLSSLACNMNSSIRNCS